MTHYASHRTYATDYQLVLRDPDLIKKSRIEKNENGEVIVGFLYNYQHGEAWQMVGFRTSKDMNTGWQVDLDYSNLANVVIKISRVIPPYYVPVEELATITLDCSKK